MEMGKRREGGRIVGDASVRLRALREGAQRLAHVAEEGAERALELLEQSDRVGVGLVALLLGDALSPGRLPPMLAFYAACGAGVSLILGLAMLERRGAPHGLAAFEGR